MPDGNNDGRLFPPKGEIRIIQDKSDSLTIKPLARGGLTYELKVYADFSDDPNKEIDRILGIKKKVDEKLGLKENPL